MNSEKVVSSNQNISIEEVERIVNFFGYTALRPSPSDWQKFKDDLSEEDRASLGGTWRQDWETEMEATYTASENLFMVTSLYHPGSAVFGVTRVDSDLAQIWLLQSQTFHFSAAQHNGSDWPLKIGAMAKGFCSLAKLHFGNIFCFAPKDRTDYANILSAAGFDVFEHPNLFKGIALFVDGPNGKSLAKNQLFWSSFLGPSTPPERLLH